MSVKFYETFIKFFIAKVWTCCLTEKQEDKKYSHLLTTGLSTVWSREMLQIHQRNMKFLLCQAGISAQGFLLRQHVNTNKYMQSDYLSLYK